MSEKEELGVQAHDKCGSMSGYNRHFKRKEEPCIPCRDAQRQWWKDRRKTHATHINILRREWRARTPNANRNRMHRAKAAGGVVGYYSDLQVLELYGTDCHICGETIDLTASRQCGRDGWEKGLHIDHVIPLSKGGADSLENVRPAHGQCNIIKWAKLDNWKAGMNE
jgi:5-methylcytosine-specific restriction endonuclease McrA